MHFIELNTGEVINITDISFTARLEKPVVFNEIVLNWKLVMKSGQQVCVTDITYKHIIKYLNDVSESYRLDEIDY